ncbi:alpha-ketoglutarate-dependent dioxygenase alkB homolog 4 [Anolis carolinensis]|uniref:alpha-ketoglutarate-dependent dioxygenase alkB homolog 4 n=1 Tax=Anolis carolinensis TaxID=28377 RepID=UPI002F2B6AB4
MEGGGGGERGGGEEAARPRACACTGARSCLACQARRPTTTPTPPPKNANFVYCPTTGFAVGEKPSGFAGWAFPFPGVCLLDDFVTAEEERHMVTLMDQSPWKPSQSGRRKQDYGPKVNFKKQKLKAGCFTGLPSGSREIVERMQTFSVLKGFSPVEQCNLDYGPERGSAIDPHWDDSWLWGERLVTLNLLSATVLSMTCDSDDPLPLLFLQSEPTHGNARDGQRCALEEFRSPANPSLPFREVSVAISLPRRALLVLYGPARHRWKHAIHRDHITSRRVCATFRELSAEFGPGGKQEKVGGKLLETALTFQGRPV